MQRADLAVILILLTSKNCFTQARTASSQLAIQMKTCSGRVYDAVTANTASYFLGRGVLFSITPLYDVSYSSFPEAPKPGTDSYTYITHESSEKTTTILPAPKLTHYGHRCPRPPPKTRAPPHPLRGALLLHFCAAHLPVGGSTGPLPWPCSGGCGGLRRSGRGGGTV